MGNNRAGKCTELFERIDALEPEYIQFLIDICKIESPTEYKEGVDRVGRFFMEKAAKKGWSVEVLPQPVAGDAVCITMNPEAQGRPVVFSGHMDTVHPVGFFGEEIVTLDEEKIYGPGVNDCKGGLTAAFYAMAALDDCGFKDRPVKLILQSDEEVGSRISNKATVRFMAKQAENCVAFLNCEPRAKGKTTVTRKGILRYQFEVTGKAVHASNCYDGASAVREAAYKIIELEKLKDKDGLTCNCGMISGGTAANTVPGKCVFTADIRFLTQDEMLQADKLVKEIAEKTFVVGTYCQVTLKSQRCAMERTKQNEDLLDKLNEIFEEAGLSRLTGSHSNGGSDAADITAYGLPCLDSFGMSGGGIHTRNEWASLDSLKESAKYLAAAAYCI